MRFSGSTVHHAHHPCMQTSGPSCTHVHGGEWIAASSDIGNKLDVLYVRTCIVYDMIMYNYNYVSTVLMEV